MAGKYGSLFGDGGKGGGMGGSGGGMKVKVSFSDLEEVKCELCGERVFGEGMMLRVMSALLSGTGKEEMVAIPVTYCIKCNGVLERFLPEELRSKKLSI